MIRRGGELAIVLVALSAGAAGLVGQTVVPVQFGPQPRGATFPPQGIGPNGLRLEPYTRTVDVGWGETETVLVGGWAFRDYCADDDGCDLRLISDGASRRIATVRSFVTNATVDEWYVGSGFTEGVAGRNRNTVKQEVLRLSVTGNAECTLFDDLPTDDGVHFHLQADSVLFDEVYCTLRIED